MGHIQTEWGSSETESYLLYLNNLRSLSRYIPVTINLFDHYLKETANVPMHIPFNTHVHDTKSVTYAVPNSGAE